MQTRGSALQVFRTSKAKLGMFRIFPIAAFMIADGAAEERGRGTCGIVKWFVLMVVEEFWGGVIMRRDLE